MSAREFLEWTAFEQVYGPILPHERIDLGFAQVTYMLASLLGKPRGGRRFKIADFLPQWLRPIRRGQTEQELQQIFQGWANANKS